MSREGHEFGGHTMTHADLGTIDSGELEYEIGVCHQTIARVLGQAREFAWPFGRRVNMNALAAEAVFKAGFRSCASAIRGCHLKTESQRRPTEMMLRRENLEANWPIPHVQYLLAKDARQAVPGNDTWPRELGRQA